MLALFEAAVELLQKMHAFVSQEQDVQEMAMMAARVGTYQLALLLGLGHAGVELVLGVARDHGTLLGRHYSNPLFSFPRCGIRSPCRVCAGSLREPRAAFIGAASDWARQGRPGY